MIAIVDYGLGNVRAFANIYAKLSLPVVIAKRASDLDRASKIILPGVGAFDHAMQFLDASGMRPRLEEKVRGGTPVLGVCVGMQILAARSEEGVLTGLGWVEGEVRRFRPPPDNRDMRIPHMGWNEVAPAGARPLMNGIDASARFYFLHSYYFVCRDPANVMAKTDYYGEFACAVGSGNVFGVQFHPEKSHSWGTRLLKNFAEL
jgi:glutamine amidotransferase